MVALGVNGATVSVTWTSTTQWRAAIPLASATNRQVVVALNSRGQAIANTLKEVLIGPSGRLTVRTEGGTLVFEYPVWRAGASNDCRAPSPWTPPTGKPSPRSRRMMEPSNFAFPYRPPRPSSIGSWSLSPEISRREIFDVLLVCV
jgi:hypothetical protein